MLNIIHHLRNANYSHKETPQYTHQQGCTKKTMSGVGEEPSDIADG